MTRLADPPSVRFRALYDANFQAILGYALRRVDQPADAADVVSETFLVAWRRLEDAPPGDFRPWLFGIARNVLLNQHRSTRRRARLGERLRTFLAGSDVSDLADDVAEQDRVRRALAVLSEADRELLTLIAWDDLSPSEAAAVLGIAAGTARMRLARARARFAEALGDAAPRPGHVRGVPHDFATEEGR